MDQLPSNIRKSTVLSGNHLGLLANVEAVTGVTALPEKFTYEVRKECYPNS